MENPIKIDDLGYHHFRKPPYDCTDIWKKNTIRYTNIAMKKCTLWRYISD